MRTLTPYGELQIKEIDEKIARLEQSIATEQERRREVINRYGMNKCNKTPSGRGHIYRASDGHCTKCGIYNRDGKASETCNPVIDDRYLDSEEIGGGREGIDDQHSHLCD